MGKLHLLQSNFTGGEIDPLLKGRVDIPRYLNGLDTLRNAYVFITGGATRRGGFKFIDNEGAGITARAIPFNIFRKDASPPVLQGYIIEFRSDNTIHFYTNGARIGTYSITSPFTGADLAKIRYEQFDNVLYLCHPDFPPQQLVRTTDTSWAISAVSFTQPATPHWDATTGYPSAITFFEQRMILAGTKADPQMVLGSGSGVITNLVTGTGDSDPFKLKLAAATSNIVHLSARTQIFVATNDKELSIQGGLEKPLTPTNVQIKVHTNYGCRETVRPLAIGSELIFATRHGKKLRSLAYDLTMESYKAPDISVVSGHLAALGIVEMARSIEPTGIIWIVTSDGKLLSVTFDRDQDVISWAEHTTDGFFKGVAVIPYNDTDQVWVMVQRTVNGSTNTHIEVLDPSLNTDAAITGTDATGKTLWTGLGHLEGKTVDIVADGVVMPQQVIAGGQITLPRAAKSVEIGLHYETVIKDLPPELQTGTGTAQGQAVSVNKITVRLYNSTGCEINGDVIPFRKFGAGILDQKVDPFTGDKFVSNIGWGSGTVTIKQTQPLPLTVLAIIKECTING